ncbi:thiol reductant ABC exporter subunit CydD [Rhodococcus sp. RS1C4]|uniref:thiol reductant ABC exporter subunit CydD n=1 Tax=Nocardiaceae TaxID=85025 RepID=UPI00037DB057|nr:MULTISPECIES: thiol reductant ABC exporter subunit CydD [Rhodococcus]OZC57799.1 thiol reductant ABC exporter subunit CydD [Rhodococcus sp. RS1C4]OZC88379.1 thiol reductant ABC exporter subunit CydD [Rhodococcus sp. 06-418-1B]OZD66255.1 thiol reductant ABC exporter subunit CydD [Rhodococcus sp. 06-1059B-a]OZE86290.1 thiol reductant ABC exporter subunit CydD [Rhodococcus sp. 15-649-1-2]OZF55948.1 thiol reductant ABC exporter subunit CydD [Rhodococcus sp. 14-2470-1a]
MSTTVTAGRGPVDPRLWRYSRSARRYLVLIVVLALIDTAAVVVSAVMLGTVLAGVITSDAREMSDWAAQLWILLGAIVVRTLAAWLQARYGHRAASRVVEEIENEVLDAASHMDPRDLDSERESIAIVVTRALGGLAPYLTGYVPSLVLAATLTPITLVVILTEDLTSALIIFFTLPLIPIFMILIGLLTKGRAEKTLESMTRLSAQLLDLVAGLPTLRALGRERGPAARVQALGDAHRRATMRALKIAFLSSMVLELLATLCVALVAVSIGLRLVFGDMALEAGIIALVLAPEVYVPLRRVGAQFHAAEDGVAAADRAFAILDRRAPTASGTAVVDAAGTGIRFESVSARSVARGQTRQRESEGTVAPYELSADIAPGTVTVLAGPNGAGKSTALNILLGLTEPCEGRVVVGDVDARSLDLRSWWDQIAWLPQRPVLVPGTLRENLEFTGSTIDLLGDTAAAVGFDRVLAELPDGWETRVGTGGVGLSLGQVQRLALTRVLSTDKPVLLLDEPTAHLDDAAEARVLTALREIADQGKTVIVVGHRPSVLAWADVVVNVRAA